MAECYEARRDDDEEAKKQHDHENAKKTTKAVAKGAVLYLGGGEAGAKAVDLIANTKLGNKVLDVASKPLESSKVIKGVNNALNDSGAVDMADKAMSANAGGGAGGGAGGNLGGATGGATGGAGAGGATPGQTPNQVKTSGGAGGGEQGGSLPSSGGDKGSKNMPNVNTGGGNEKEDDEGESSGGSSLDSGADKKGDGLFKTFVMTAPLRMILFGGLPFIALIFLVMLCIFSTVGYFSDYEDAIGISSTAGEDTGGIDFTAATPEQQDFYDRVISVKNDYQSKGKTVDTLKIVAVFHVLNTNGASISYEDMTESAIKEIADSMFSGNSYSEDTFKNNLINTIIPKYLPDSTQTERETIADDIFDYIERYFDFIGKNNDNCSSGSSGSCTYDIKGFYIEGKGNVAKNIKVTDLYVRLMQCGTANGHNYGGTFGVPMSEEELVPFEKYVLGCAYQEIGPTSPENAIKAQLVATRSYALARPTEMGGWRTLAEEDGKWILQAAACTQDQVYCDPDKGCSSSDGQWGQIYSGLDHNSGFSRDPMPEDSPMRTYASDVEGQVLINSVGNIIYSGFTSTDQNQWISLANSGLNYKQILLQHYNQGSRNYGATDIQESSCGGSSGSCVNVASGDYVNWKQYEGSWVDVPMGTSGKTIRQIGCLATSIAIQIARSGVTTNVSGEFNPGTFVEYLNNNGGFADGGNFIWSSAEMVAPSFKYSDDIDGMLGWSKQQKLDKIKELTNQDKTYVVAEVKGNTGQHWVAIDHVEGDTVKMFDPGSANTDLWAEYSWSNTSRLVVFRVS